MSQDTAAEASTGYRSRGCYRIQEYRLLQDVAEVATGFKTRGCYIQEYRLL